jgi:hypothetical protein
MAATLEVAVWGEFLKGATKGSVLMFAEGNDNKQAARHRWTNQPERHRILTLSGRKLTG